MIGEDQIRAIRRTQSSLDHWFHYGSSSFIHFVDMVHNGSEVNAVVTIHQCRLCCAGQTNGADIGLLNLI